MHGIGRARARLRGDSRRHRQHRTAARGDRAFQARRLSRHAGFPEDPARCRGDGRHRRVFAPARAGLRRRTAAVAAPGAGGARRARAPVLRHRRPRRRRLRERTDRRIGRSTRPCWSRSCGPAPAIRSRTARSARSVVTSFHPDYPMIRFATGDLSGGDAGPLAVRTHQHAADGVDGSRRPDHQGQGHVRASRPGGRGRQASSRARPVAARCGPRGRAGRDDAHRGMPGAGQRIARGGRNHAALGDQARAAR